MSNSEIQCEVCEKGIDHYWGYPQDPPRVRSKDQTLWGIQVAKPDGKFDFHYYCSKEHAKEGEKKLGYKVVGEVIDEYR